MSKKLLLIGVCALNLIYSTPSRSITLTMKDGPNPILPFRDVYVLVSPAHHYGGPYTTIGHFIIYDIERLSPQHPVNKFFDTSDKRSLRADFIRAPSITQWAIIAKTLLPGSRLGGEIIKCEKIFHLADQAAREAFIQSLDNLTVEFQADAQHSCIIHL